MRSHDLKHATDQVKDAVLHTWYQNDIRIQLLPSSAGLPHCLDILLENQTTRQRADFLWDAVRPENCVAGTRHEIFPQSKDEPWVRGCCIDRRGSGNRRFHTAMALRTGNRPGFRSDLHPMQTLPMEPRAAARHVRITSTAGRNDAGAAPSFP